MPTIERLSATRATSLPGQRPGTLATQIVRRELATRDVVVLWLARPGTLQAPAAYQPGQFISLALPGRTRTLHRSYSLCGDGSPDQPWQIAVKRRQGGAVSSFLFDRAAAGTILSATLPRGAFTLPREVAPSTPLVFVANGAGIAPIFGMLRALARLPRERRPAVQLHYASRSASEVIFARDLAALDPEGAWLRQWHYLTARGERLSPDHALAALATFGKGTQASAAHWYICGGGTLKRAFQQALPARGVPVEHLHVEVFDDEGAGRMGGRPTVDAGGPVVARVHLANVDRGAGALDVRRGETLLDALERQGYAPDVSCRAGDCGVCRLRLLSGSVRDPGIALSRAERAAGYILPCVAQPDGDLALAPDGLFALDMPGGVGAGARRARRSSQRLLRVGSAAAAIALFTGAWTLTNHKVAAGIGGDGVSGDDGQPAPLQSQSGDDDNRQRPGGVTISPFQSSPNTRSGTS
jgi:ferredoxin-NADP reductase